MTVYGQWKRERRQFFRLGSGRLHFLHRSLP